MIQANELRIGNIVKCKTSNDAKLYSVIAVDGYNLKVMLDGVRHGEWQSEERLIPIKLTVDEIVKFGFVKNIISQYYELKNIEIHVVRNSLIVFLNPYLSVDIKYLHQIQNLYHSLTGEELTINL